MATTYYGTGSGAGEEAELMAAQPLHGGHHRSQLPSWNRPALGTHASVPRTLNKDKVGPAQISRQGRSVRSQRSGGKRVQDLEKTLSFLSEQHVDTLRQLHREAEVLKKENRELKFQLVMCRCRQRAADPGCAATMESPRRLLVNASKDEGNHSAPADEMVALEEKVRELRKSLSLERSKNAWLLRVIEQKILGHRHDSGESGLRVPSEGMPGGHRTSLRECEGIIRDLQTKNNQQNHELTQLKADLHDVLYSHKWTPDAYLMARAYVSGQEEGQEGRGFPRVAAQEKKEMVDRAYQRVQDCVVLPALVPRLPANIIAERHKRSHALRGGGAGSKMTGRERTSLKHT